MLKSISVRINTILWKASYYESILRFLILITLEWHPYSPHGASIELSSHVRANSPPAPSIVTVSTRSHTQIRRTKPTVLFSSSFPSTLEILPPPSVCPTGSYEEMCFSPQQCGRVLDVFHDFPFQHPDHIYLIFLVTV